MAPEKFAAKSQFEPDDICPPYWPSIIWWLEHHQPGIGPTPPHPEPYREMNELFAAIAIQNLAAQLPKEASRLIKEVTGTVITNAASKFAFPNPEDDGKIVRGPGGPRASQIQQ